MILPIFQFQSLNVFESCMYMCSWVWKSEKWADRFGSVLFCYFFVWKLSSEIESWWCRKILFWSLWLWQSEIIGNILLISLNLSNRVFWFLTLARFVLFNIHYDLLEQRLKLYNHFALLAPVQVTLIKLKQDSWWWWSTETVKNKKATS